MATDTCGAKFKHDGCKNLENLTVVNPVVVSDELFVGEVPDLAVTPFRSLKSLTFESDTITGQVGRFLLRHSTRLETFHLNLSRYDAAAKGLQLHCALKFLTILGPVGKIQERGHP